MPRPPCWAWTKAGLDQFEALLTAPDQEVYAWLRGAEPVPAEYDNPVFAGLKAVCGRKGYSGTARLHRQDRRAAHGLGRARRALTPGWRRKRRAGGAARCCSSPATKPQAEALAAAVAFFRARSAAAAFSGLGLPALRPCLAQARYRKRAAGHLGGAGQRHRRPGTDRDQRGGGPAARAAARGHRRSKFRRAGAGEEVDRDALVAFLAGNGYARAGTVRDPGDFALRGGIVDLWPPGSGRAAATGFLRRDAGRDPQIRRRQANCRMTAWSGSRFCPPAKRPLSQAAISRFRAGYVAAFGPSGDDPLYESVSAGRKAQGMEHWLPLFYDGLDTLFDYLPRSLVMLGHQVEEAKAARLEVVSDCLRHPRAVPPPGAASTKPQGCALQAAEAGNALSERRGMESRAGPSSGARSHAVPGAGRQGQRRCRRPPGPRFRAGTHRRQSQCLSGGGRSSSGVAGGRQARGGGKLDRRLGRTHGRRSVRPRHWRHPPHRGLAGSAETGHARAVGLACLGIERGFEAPDFARDERAGHAGRPHGAGANAPAPRPEFPLRSVCACARRSGHAHRTWRGPLSGAESDRSPGRAA